MTLEITKGLERVWIKYGRKLTFTLSRLPPLKLPNLKIGMPVITISISTKNTWENLDSFCNLNSELE